MRYNSCVAKPWARLRRRRDGGSEDDDDSVRVADSSEHEWWAARDELDHAYVPPVKNAEPADEAPRRDTFTDYFSTESLFSWGTTPPKAEPPPQAEHVEEEWWDGTDPYAVLGVPETATWEEISIAHRRLAKLHHPDRLLHATDEDRARSERRMRELNIAYSELRRRRGR